MRVDFGHRFAHQRGDVAWEAIAIGLAPAEKQAFVSAEPEVVDDKFGVRDGYVLSQNFYGLIAQRFGCRDEIVDRHDTGGNLAVHRA